MHGKGIPVQSLVVVKYPSAWEDCLGIVIEKADGHSDPVSVVSLQGGKRSHTIVISDIGLKIVSEDDDINFVTPEEAILGWQLKGVIAAGAVTWNDHDSYYATKFELIEQEMAKCRLEK